jgi:predicted transcriptional regulator of viral defense system
MERPELLRFAICMNNRSMCSRLGYLLERFGTDADVLLNNASREYVKLDFARPKSRVWDQKWRVNVNLGDRELLGWKET